MKQVVLCQYECSECKRIFYINYSERFSYAWTTGFCCPFCKAYFSKFIKEIRLEGEI